MLAFIGGFFACFFGFFIFGYVLLALEDDGYDWPYCTDRNDLNQSFEETAR